MLTNEKGIVRGTFVVAEGKPECCRIRISNWNASRVEVGDVEYLLECEIDRKGCLGSIIECEREYA